MYKVSELVGKPLVLLKNARFLGTISSVFFDNKLKTAKCISVIDEDFNTFFLSINSISCLDFDVAICKNLFFVNAKKSACDNSTLNKQNDCVCESNLPIEQNFCQKTTTLCAKSDFETKKDSSTQNADLYQHSPLKYLNGPINCYALSQNGKNYGLIKDVLMQKNLVIKIITEKGSFLPQNVICRSNNLVILNI